MTAKRSNGGVTHRKGSGIRAVAVIRAKTGDSPGDVIDLDAEFAVAEHAADERDARAIDADLAADERDTHVVDVRDGEQVALERLFAERDRATAALDRKEAALDRHRASEYLRHAYRDTLTGAMQHEAGQDQLEHEVARSREDDAPLTIAFVDIVGLGRTNEDLGRAAGDRVLAAVGSALRCGLRAYDSVVRWGGDEFVCALPGSSTTDAGHRFTQIQIQLQTAFPGAAMRIGLTDLRASDALQDVINRADHDLYEHREHEMDPAAGR